jgi:trimethylamine---corrinoid protein Co-methyltransferase
MIEGRKRRGGRKLKIAAAENSARVVNYRQLRHPFAPQRIFSDDQVQAIHEAALTMLETLGIKFLLPEARDLLRAAGALVDDSTQMVRIGRDIVEAAIASAPKSIHLRASNPIREQIYEQGTLLFTPGSGCPNATDMESGRRPGSLQDFEEAIKLQQSFDVIHKHGPSAEPQDIPIQFRHHAMIRAQMTLGDKPMFVYARGRGQIEQSFDLIRAGLNLSEDDFRDGVWATTVINTNSPRQVDNPMAQGIIDFARAGQMSIITPFCLAGAMAPVTVAGALTLQHGEALACIALAQVAAKGAPVSYGGFSSNVDMKSGAPAFGTPEHVKMQIGSGQLARLIGFPWRSAAGSASNVADVQGATENVMGLWGALQAGATMVVHSAGWLEGGLSFGYEKFICDVEALQSLAELCAPTPADAAAIGMDALAEVEPGGHFFAAAHTMERYNTAFYEPIVADLSNFGAWTEAGGKTATERALGVWQQVLRDYHAPRGSDDIAHRLAPMIEAMEKSGGAAPLD